MLVRSWRGWAAADNAEAYRRHFRQAVLPELRGIAGFRRARLLRARRDGEIEYLVLTEWDSEDAIRAFAGADIARAVVEPQAVAALLRFDARVQHHEVVEDSA